MTEITDEEIRRTTPEKYVAFLREAARYFRKRDTGGEDRAFWANVYNAENCEKIAAWIAERAKEPS